MAAPWPQWLTTSFVSANQPQLADDGSVYYGPYTRLYHPFGIEGPFEISPQLHTAHDSIDVVALFVVELNKHPVLFIAVKSPGSFTLDSKRKEADGQMRGRFRALRNSVVTPRLPGISAFGTRLAFYEYVTATTWLTPSAIVPDPEYLNDVAPAERWTHDLLDANGAARIRQVVQRLSYVCCGKLKLVISVSIES